MLRRDPLRPSRAAACCRCCRSRVRCRSPISPSERRQARKSMLRSGPPRFRFQPRSRPPHLPASMIRSRRNSMLCLSLAERSHRRAPLGILRAMQATIAGPLFDAQDPPGGSATAPVTAVTAPVRPPASECLRRRPRAGRLAVAGADAPVVLPARRERSARSERRLRSGLRESADDDDLRERHVESDLHLVDQRADGRVAVGGGHQQRRLQGRDLSR